jgi:hypothetical protein
MAKRDDHDEDEDDRVTRSLAGLAAVLFLALIAIYLIMHLRAVGELQDCVMSGRTNCAPIDTR